MAVAVSEIEAQDLRRLIPLNMLSGDRFEQLCSEVNIEDAPRGSVLFSKGDTKNEFVYVLKGTISLQADGMELETITGGTESSRFALAHQIPRKVSAIAKDKVRFLRVESEFVNQSSTPFESRKANYEVREVRHAKDDDWVTTLLSSPIFQRLSPANLQQLLVNLEEISVKAGQQIIQQSDPGDYYYVIKKGRCALSRKPSKNAREIKLAELKTCDTFGEDSLISDEPRNVNVTMVTDGSLLRLNKANFLKLVKEPVISYVDYTAAQKLVSNGAGWLDVRPTDEFAQGHLPNAINIPFFMLRMELGNLSRDRAYVLICEIGRVSEAAAFLLIRNSFDAFVLQGGLASLPERATQLSMALPTTTIKSSPGTQSPDLKIIDYAPDSPMEATASVFTNGESMTLSELSDRGINVAESASSFLSEGLDINGSATDHVSLESKLAAVLAANGRMEAELSALKRASTSANAQPDAERARLKAESRARELEAQVAELSSVVQDFLEQQSSDTTDEIQSVRSELETVRSQASADVASLQTKLRAADQEVSRLRHELDGTYAQVLQLQSGVNLADTMPNAHGRWRQTVVPIAVGLVAFILGMVITLAVVRSTEFGRSLLVRAHPSDMTQMASLGYRENSRES